MEGRTNLEYLNFFCKFGPPYKSFFQIMTLKSGMYIICILDIIIGCTGIIEAVIFFIEFISELNYYYYIETLIGLLDFIGLIFAVMCIRSLETLSQGNISNYYSFKFYEYFLIAIMKLGILITNTYDQSSTVVFTFFITYVQRYLAIFIVKYVWSFDIRLKNNEVKLITVGEEALRAIAQGQNSGNQVGQFFQLSYQ
jgi:hypothetical protein